MVTFRVNDDWLCDYLSGNAAAEPRPARDMAPRPAADALRNLQYGWRPALRTSRGVGARGFGAARATGGAARTRRHGACRPDAGRDPWEGPRVRRQQAPCCRGRVAPPDSRAPNFNAKPPPVRKHS